MASGGMGQHGHSIPVEWSHSLRGKTRAKPSVPFGPRVGIARGSTSPASHAGAERWTGIGVVAGVGTGVLLRPGPHGTQRHVPWNSA